MKPVPFEYERPHSLQAACQLLADDEDAVIIAGGQTLIPMLAMRLARPSRLIDISRIDVVCRILMTRIRLMRRYPAFPAILMATAWSTLQTCYSCNGQYSGNSAWILSSSIGRICTPSEMVTVR